MPSSDGNVRTAGVIPDQQACPCVSARGAVFQIGAGVSNSEGYIHLHAQYGRTRPARSRWAPNILEIGYRRDIPRWHPLIVHFQHFRVRGAGNEGTRPSIDSGDAGDVRLAFLDQAFITKPGAAEQRHGTHQLL